jgi:hypothetical protein
VGHAPAPRTRRQEPKEQLMPGPHDATTASRVFPPPLLRTWPLGIQLVLAGLTPVVFGLICGAVLRTSGAAFLALQGIGIAGGFWAGLEHAGPWAGAARGVTGGLLFGTCILLGHEVAGGSDQGLLPSPQALQVVITVSLGTLLGTVGARSRKRMDGLSRS